MKCERCNNETGIYTGSYFNTQMICMACEAKERAHPRFGEAQDAEIHQVESGNMNFHGIGLPSDLH